MSFLGRYQGTAVHQKHKAISNALGLYYLFDSLVLQTVLRRSLGSHFRAVFLASQIVVYCLI